MIVSGEILGEGVRSVYQISDIRYIHLKRTGNEKKTGPVGLRKTRDPLIYQTGRIDREAVQGAAEWPASVGVGAEYSIKEQGRNDDNV